MRLVIPSDSNMELDPPMDYLLGSTDAEHERLIRQANRLAPATERFFREAGIAPGLLRMELAANGDAMEGKGYAFRSSDNHA